MKTFKVPVSRTDLPTLVYKLRQDSSDKLTKFCTQQIIDSKLSTKNFSYEFDLSNARSGGQRKSIQKLKDIIFKAVKKRILYLDHTKNGDMVSSSTNGTVCINLVSPFIRVRRDSTGEDHPTRKLISRYCRYLNSKCIKAGIPIHCSPRFTNSLHKDDDVARTGGAADPYVRISVSTIITILLVEYAFSGYRSTMINAPEPPFSSYADYEKFLVEKVEEGDADARETLKRYKTVSAWEAGSLGRVTTVDCYKGREKYRSPEKLFLILDDLQKVIMSLSRKTSYDTTAFNIGSSQDT